MVIPDKPGTVGTGWACPPPTPGAGVAQRVGMVRTPREATGKFLGHSPLFPQRSREGSGGGGGASGHPER